MSLSLWLVGLLAALILGWLVGGRRGAIVGLVTSLAWLVIIQRATKTNADLSALLDMGPGLGFLAVVVGLAVSMDRAFAWYQHAHRHDPATGLVQADSFTEVLQSELDRALRYDRPFSLLYLRSDLLTPDASQLSTGERETMRPVTAALVTAALRSVDLVAEVRDGEFAVIMPETGAEQVLAAAARLKEGLPAVVRCRSTTAIGTVTVIATRVEAPTLLQHARELMLESAEDALRTTRHEVLGARSPAP